MCAYWKTLRNPVKLLFLSALAATLTFTLSNLLPQHFAYLDAASSLQVTEVQEVNLEPEAPGEPDDASVILSATRKLQFSGNLNTYHLFFCEFASRLAFLYQIRPRYPPTITDILI